MNFAEFKHWLDGFSEAMGDAPTPEQWAKIKAKLAQVNAYTVGDFGKVMPREPSYQEPLRTGSPYTPMLPLVTCNPFGNAKAS